MELKLSKPIINSAQLLEGDNLEASFELESGDPDYIYYSVYMYDGDTNRLKISEKELSPGSNSTGFIEFEGNNAKLDLKFANDGETEGIEKFIARFYSDAEHTKQIPGSDFVFVVTDKELSQISYYSEWKNAIGLPDNRITVLSGISVDNQNSIAIGTNGNHANDNYIKSFKYSPDGELLFESELLSEHIDDFKADGDISITSDGGVIHTGYRWDSDIAVIAKVNNEGLYEWSTEVEKDNGPMFEVSTIDKDGNIIAVGRQGLGDQFFYKLNPKGEVLWSKRMNQLDSYGASFATSLSTDSSNNIYIASDTQNPGTSQLTSMHPVGWNGGVELEVGSRSFNPQVAVDDQDNIYFLGGDNQVVKLDADGSTQWSTNIGYTSGEWMGLAVNSSGVFAATNTGLPDTEFRDQEFQNYIYKPTIHALSSDGELLDISRIDLDGTEGVGSYAFAPLTDDSFAFAYRYDGEVRLQRLNINQEQSTSLSHTDALALIEDQGNDVIIPEEYDSIEDNAFKGTSLTSVVIPDNVTSIGNEAFSSTQLTSVEMPDSVTSIGRNAFWRTQLKSVVIPDSVISMGDRAFGYNNLLASVDIGDGVKSIGHGAFANCMSLTSILIPDSVTEIAQWAFTGTSLKHVFVPEGAEIHDAAFDRIVSIKLKNSELTKSDAEGLIEEQGNDVIIPEGYGSIGSGAFLDTELTSVEIPNSVTEIGDQAFQGTGLTSVSVPEGIEIHESAFEPSVQINYTSTTPVDGSGAVAFNYKLFSADSNEALDQLAVLGQGVDGTDRYKLEITAQSLTDQYNLESADVTLKFNPLIFQAINASDIQIGTDLPLANAVHIDNETGAVRIAASSLSDLSQGDGISSERILASLILDFDEGALKTVDLQEDGSLAVSPLIFEIEANNDETVFSRSYTEDDGSGLLNRDIKSLRDLGGDIHVDGTEVKLYSAGINIYEVDDGLILGSQRVIGSDTAYTNLIRSGDTITATTEWLNVGNTDANNIQVTAYDNDNAQLSDYHFVDDISNVKSGRYVKGQFDQSDRESFELVADIEITGAAGNVLDLSDGILSLQADDSDVFVNNKGSSNLITFQGDLNYDGRVSMKDLAYLNAGAARQQLVDKTDESGNAVQDENGNVVQVASEASYARDVDADFSGKIDLADLAKLDQDWGQTLHNGDQDFHGSSEEFSWSDLDEQGTTGDAAWNNDSFKDQNATEASSDYVSSLEAPGTSGVIGADGDTIANDEDMQGTEFQDPLTL
ncbi:leucine-rich repeat protein [Prochlorococcus sp. MIT 1303]|uniref:leucine-rich repeat protein n=1 Tax=Prochlorococcus sp. MIT 1303 TaxID=1723647 RepID=UPI0007BBE021|nr:leucine-rich repeat protein [Prochlorococcus sp. MIT 1303]KZR64422.1 hypothetical protein PMIT1303_01467 [Prochlorococcus sp. MIT 1303]